MVTTTFTPQTNGFAFVSSWTVVRALADWIANALPQAYDLCGGMAFAALDYCLAKSALPRGSGQMINPPVQLWLVISCAVTYGSGY